MNLRTSLLAALVALLPHGALGEKVADRTASEFPGARARYHGFDRYDLDVDGVRATVVAPRREAAGRPWLWHGEFFGSCPELDLALLARGFHIAYLNVPDLFGSPRAMRHWDAFYGELTARHHFARKVALTGVSRGGLYAFNWAAANPQKAACIYADAPVCDLRSWPLGQGAGSGNASEVPKLLAAYGVDSVEQLLARAINPIDRLEPLATADVPLLHVYGDADTGVPWDENTGVVAERYRELGGHIELIPKPGIGHVHGLDDSTPIVEFVARYAQPASLASTAPVKIGSRRELFVDRRLIDQLVDAELVLREPRDEGQVIAFDEPWEGPHAGYATVIKDGDQYLMYYRGVSKLANDGSPFERTCVAESPDGVHWAKPRLSLFEFEGSLDNNIVLADAAPATHNLCPMLDTRPGVPKQQRFKALGGNIDRLYAYVSPDGRKWTKLQEDPVLTKEHVKFPHVHLFDSQNVPFWSEAEQFYVCYFRVWDGVRRIARSTSKDFVHWTPAVMMEQLHDDGRTVQPAPTEHLYTNQTAPYFRAPHIYVAIAARFFEGRQVISDRQAREIGVSPDYYKDTSDSVFMTSRGGSVYDRTFLEGYLKPGIGYENWVSRTNYPALNVVPTGPAEMSFYVNHDYAQPSAHLRRYSLRLDGFCSVSAGAKQGELVTKPVVFDGNRLLVNFATSAAGGLRFSLLDADGRPYDGFALEDCQELIGNEIEREVIWRSGSNVGDLAGKPVRVRCELHDADLYSIQFTP